MNKSKDDIETTNEEEQLEEPHDLEVTEEIDLEKNGAAAAALQRQDSGAPYSVFGKGMKIWIIFLVSVSALISPFGATTFLPALNVLTEVLDITPTQVNISITTYMVCTHV